MGHMVLDGASVSGWLPGVLYVCVLMTALVAWRYSGYRSSIYMVFKTRPKLEDSVLSQEDTKLKQNVHTASKRKAKPNPITAPYVQSPRTRSR